MPGGDRSGPAGRGPMTGRGAGNCGGYETPGFTNPHMGRGFRGRGFGFSGGGGFGGRGRRHGFHATGLPGWQRGGWQGAAAPYGPEAAYPNPYPYGPAPEPDPKQEMAALKQEARYLNKAMEEIKGRMAELETEEKAPKKS